ncbi:MAG: putative sulfate exporter family transporter [Acidocella sp.]|nr:putative sulfate exporter family transporter [Acidocella sp.]
MKHILAPLPGLAVCLALTGVAIILQHIEFAILNDAYLEALVLAILLGLAVRAAWLPGARFQPGIHFAAKFLLELAVVLLGAAVSARSVLRLGPGLLIGIVAAVFVSILVSYFICRALRLPSRLSLLVACGNSICGNSAIVAVAPVIGADADDIAASIAFTAVLGVIVVLLLPLLVPLLALTLTQYGILAGLTVYAVPQVLAATLPIGALSNQVGTVVKLVRVLMLGPVVFILAMLTARLREETDEPAPHLTAGERPSPGMPKLHQLVPWFILGFLVLLGLRSGGLIPVSLLSPTKSIASLLTTISMAALGLGVDVRAVARAGGRVTLAVTLSLLMLAALSLGLIWLLGIR